MKKLTSSLIGGIAGAVALNLLHQIVQHFDHDAPRVDLVGEEALTKCLNIAGVGPVTGNNLFVATLAADLLSNGAYYSLIGFGKKTNLPYHGLAHGLCAGLGALFLTKPMGLNDAPVTRTDRTKVMTVAWYTFGGLIAGLIMQPLRKK